MDQTFLVASGRELTDLLDSDGIPPRAAMWAYSGDDDVWKLWIVPPKQLNDKHDFYRRVATIVSRNRASLHGLDSADVQMMSDKHPAIVALSKMLQVGGTSDVRLTSNMLDGFYLPDGIVLRMDLARNN